MMSLKDNSNKSKEWTFLGVLTPLTYASIFGVPSLSVQILKKYDGKSYSYAHLKVYGVVMIQYKYSDKLMVQTFLKLDRSRPDLVHQT